jgi:hypothetical protein
MMRSLSRAKRASITGLSLLLLTFVMAPSSGAAELKFTASIDPTEAIAGVEEDFEILITNTGSGSGGSATIQSVAIHIPSGFSVDPTSLGTSNGAWPVAIDGEYIKAYKTGSNEIPVGSSITISFSATASAAGEYEWTTSAFHGADWTTLCTIQGNQPTVTVTSLDFIFAGWRPPVQLPPPAVGPEAFNWHQTVPVKFLVVDGAGNPVTEGVEVVVQIGSSAAVAAVWDPEYPDYPNQWKAEVRLNEEDAGAGPVPVTITGNVTDVEELYVIIE